MQVLQEVYELSGDRVWTAASGFGGGIGRHQSICGALSGGAMAIGLRKGMEAPDPKRIGGEIRPVVRGLLDGFKERFGAIECRDLVGFDFSTPQGHDAFAESGDKQAKCHRYVRHVVESLVG